VWLYARFTLSFRDVDDLLSERGIDVSSDTVRRWFLKFGRLIAVNLRRNRPRPSSNWHLDEMVIKVHGRKHWLWRVVDDEGEVLDFLVQPRRCARLAQWLLRKLPKKQGFAPKRITTDKSKSYIAGISPTMPVDPRCRLQRLLRPTPSSIPPQFQAASSQDVRCLAN
jgi:transposase-like protein